MEKEIKDIEEEHGKAESEFNEQQKEKKRVRDMRYYLAKKEEFFGMKERNNQS